MYIFRRLIAYGIDIMIIGGYAVLLFKVTTEIQLTYDISTIGMSPLEAQLVGLLTLTIPAFLYLILSEKSSKGATIGKRLMALRVVVKDEQQRTKSILIRNAFKLVPWEIAHFGRDCAFELRLRICRKIAHLRRVCAFEARLRV